MDRLRNPFNSKTRMPTINSRHKPVGKVAQEELFTIGELCVEHNAIISTDEVHDSLYYGPMVQMATLSPEIRNLTLPVGPLQEACAVGYEKAEDLDFWDESHRSMKAKIDRFAEVCDELGLPYSDPQGGYFVMVNLSKVKISDEYMCPPHVASRPRDFKLSWFLIIELGVAAIPPGEFYLPESTHVAENYLRFVICKEEFVQKMPRIGLGT
ncbi:aminotransferase class i and ii [Seiridium cupressi]